MSVSDAPGIGAGGSPAAAEPGAGDGNGNGAHGMAYRAAAVLRRATGLEVDLIGAWSVERAITDRIQTLSARTPSTPLDLHAYLALLDIDAQERQWLIEAVVVPETWFFRHAQSFDFLATAALERWRLRTRQDESSGPGPSPWQASVPLRIASIPCSTGEEPYSIAMALLDAGLPTTSFTVDAIDISSVSLDQARAGHYRRNAFRGADLGFRDRYFTRDEDVWTIKPNVQAGVAFRTGNLVSDTLFSQAKIYDFIFCRNVLIYFDRPTQYAVIERLRNSLRDDGHLLVGPAETALVAKVGMSPTPAPLAFAFQRGESTAAARVRLAASMPLASTPTSTTLGLLGTLPRVGTTKGIAAPTTLGLSTPTATSPAGRSGARVLTTSAPAARMRPLAPSTGQSGTAMARDGGSDAGRLATERPLSGSRASTVARPETGEAGGNAASRRAPADSIAVRLATAENLANLGQLVEAEAACRAVLAETGPSADGYCLLGLIADSSGRPTEGREHFRRALYLDAAHVGALMQLAAHLSMDGDESGAARLLARARRARPDLF